MKLLELFSLLCLSLSVYGEVNIKCKKIGKQADCQPDGKWPPPLAIRLRLSKGEMFEFPTKEFVETLKPAVEKCEANTGVDKGLVDQFSKGTMVDDPKLKCYMKCIFLEFQVLNETTGYFRYEKMLSMMPQEMRSVAYDMGRNCIHFKGEGGADLCQVSFDLHRCWQQADPEHYFLM